MVLIHLQWQLQIKKSKDMRLLNSMQVQCIHILCTTQAVEKMKPENNIQAWRGLKPKATALAPQRSWVLIHYEPNFVQFYFSSCPSSIHKCDDLMSLKVHVLKHINILLDQHFIPLKTSSLFIVKASQIHMKTVQYTVVILLFCFSHR